MSLLLPGVAGVVLGLTGIAPLSTGAADCTDGVAVVVDLTDVGGEVEVGCAAGDPASGREALEQAGFTPTDSIPGMICAIDARPDPCPEEFDGSFWSYWAGEDGQWVAHLEGADSVDPAPGDVEGWRYNDGTTGPGLSPAEVAAADAGAQPGDTADEEAADEEPVADEPTADADDATDAGAPTALWWALGGVAALAVVAALVVRSRRR
ncbi:hypothetical protein [Georgenia sp. H159]|uniref:hypothetical protein n=1 Tax=Georgenia sp. H159 TaxID=3076115 RepID=UPI002D76A31E|nr:hypothetical protein [Georgenia sp. H159]